MILLLINGDLINEPILYLSLYLKQNHSTYYNLLQEVREHGKWEAWLEFFLNAILSSSKQAITTINDINLLLEEDGKKIAGLGRARFSCQQTLEHLKQLPQTSVPLLASKLEISAPTARSSLNNMVKIGILTEKTGKQRDKVYIYKEYLNILEDGAEPL